MVLQQVIWRVWRSELVSPCREHVGCCLLPIRLALFDTVREMVRSAVFSFLFLVPKIQDKLLHGRLRLLGRFVVAR
jgi:hypothetical protein